MTSSHRRLHILSVIIRFSLSLTIVQEEKKEKRPKLPPLFLSVCDRCRHSFDDPFRIYAICLQQDVLLNLIEISYIARDRNSRVYDANITKHQSFLFSDVAAADVYIDLQLKVFDVQSPDENLSFIGRATITL